MTRRFRRFGQVVAVGRPGERLPLLGASRGYLPLDDWQGPVSMLIKGARVVLLLIGPSDGTVWEYVEAVRLLEPARLVLLVDCDLPAYYRFRALADAEYARRSSADPTAAPTAASTAAPTGSWPRKPLLPDLPTPPYRSAKVQRMAEDNKLRLGWRHGRMALIVFDPDWRAGFVPFDPTQELSFAVVRLMIDRAFRPVRDQLDALGSRREVRRQRLRSALRVTAGSLALILLGTYTWVSEQSKHDACAASSAPSPGISVLPCGDPVGVAALSMSPDGHLLASEGVDGTIKLWDVTDPAHPTLRGQPPPDPENYESDVVAFSPDGKVLATGSFGGVIQLWSVADPSNPSLLAGAPEYRDIRALAFSPDGHVLAVADASGTIRLWKVTDPAIPIRLSPLPSGVPASGRGVFDLDSVAFSSDGHLLAGASFDDAIQLWDVQHDPRARDRQPAVLVIDDPTAVVVAEDRVVERRQEAHRGRRVGVGTRRVGKVEQLAAALVAEGDELLADRGDRGRQTRQAAPGTQVGDGRRAERGQVAPGQSLTGRVDWVGRVGRVCWVGAVRGRRVDVPPQPGRQQHVANPGLRPPQAARRQLRHRDEGGDDHLAERPRPGRRPAIGEAPGDLAHRAGLPVGHHRPAGRRELVEVDPVEFAAVDAQDPLAQHRGVAGPPGQDVVGGQEMDGAAHEVGPHHLPSGQQHLQLSGIERVHPGPEPDERLLRLLGLQPAEMRDGVEDGQVGAIEEELPGERRPVERPAVQEGHGREIAFGSRVSVCRARRPDSRCRPGDGDQDAS